VDGLASAVTVGWVRDRQRRCSPVKRTMNGRTPSRSVPLCSGRPRSRCLCVSLDAYRLKGTQLSKSWRAPSRARLLLLQMADSDGEWTVMLRSMN